MAPRGRRKRQQSDDSDGEALNLKPSTFSKVVPSSLSVPVTPGENDISRLPDEVLRAELIRRKYHPAIVSIMPHWQLISEFRDDRTRPHSAGHKEPDFGASAPIPDEQDTSTTTDDSRFHGFSRYPQTVVTFSHLYRFGQTQPLQSAPAEAEPVVKEREIPDELPLEMAVEFLNYGVHQTAIDELTKKQIGRIMDGFDAKMDVAEIAAAVGLARGGRPGLVGSGADEEGGNDESERESQENNEEEDDPRDGRF
jgi:hypothetical protein